MCCLATSRVVLDLDMIFLISVSSNTFPPTFFMLSSEVRKVSSLYIDF